MAEFPKLKTGVAAQYPVDRERRYDSERVRFLDMSEQGYSERAETRRRWRLELSQLDEAELAEVCEFFAEMRGPFDRFDFEDPETLEVVPNCRFDQEELEAERVAEFDGRTFLTIAETP